MTAKVDQETKIETHPVRNSTAMSSSASSVGSSKIPMIKRKAGFVIPKNKFSGSLVPIFKGGKKSESDDAVSEESTKQVQRKTKWGSDLTQDSAVRRGRALAYQTRVDQITEQLKLGSLSGDGQSLKSAGAVKDSKLSTALIDYEKLQALELERWEAIGEILKLNPGYKAPSDYQPVMREATVCVPVKEHPRCNFVGLVYGPDGDTHKRLEKETGCKIQVFGRKSQTEEKGEITASDSSEVSCYDEVYVQILAESYEKVDAAAALIELLLSSVLGKSAASSASSSVSIDNAQVLSEVQDMAPVTAVSSAMTGQELVQPVMGPVSTSSQGSFQPYPGPWFPSSQPNMHSGQAPIPSSVTFTFNPSPMHPVFGPRLGAPFGFGSSPQNTPVGPSRLQPPVQANQGQFVPAFPLGQTGPPRNHPPRVPVPQLPERPLTPTASSPGWAVPPAGGPQSLAAGTLTLPIVSSQGSVISQPLASVPGRPSAPLISPPAFPSQVAPTSAPSFVSSQIRSSSGMPSQSFTPQTSLNSSTNTVLRPAQTPVLPPPLSYVPQSAVPSPAVGAPNTPSFTPLKPMGGAAPRPPLQGPSDFTFQLHRPQGPPQSAPGPGLQFTSQRPPSAQLPPPPQAASFGPTLQNVIPQHVRPNFSRPQIGNQMGPAPVQFGPLSPNHNFGPRNLGPVPLIPNAAGPFPPRVGHSAQFQQSYPAPPLGRRGGFVVANQHSSSSGRPQVYDPFSPTSVSDQGSNISVTKKQESDPEYEDLMASVGVK